MTRTLRAHSLRGIALWLALVGVACGSSDRTLDGSVTDAPTGTDAPLPDLGPPDAGYPPGTTCDSTMVVMGSTTSSVSAMFDTTLGPPGMRDLGFNCGNADPMMGAGRWPAQEVLEYHVAGSGPQRIDFTMINGGTPRGFDTLIQVRTTCTLVPLAPVPQSCFDDTGTDHRSSGSYSAMGGSTVYFFVTGFAIDTPMAGMADHGPGQVDFTQHPATAPVETMAQAFFVGGRYEVDTSGMDANGDAVGMLSHFVDASGMPVDITGDGVTNGNDDLALAYATSVDTMTSFSGSGVVAELIAAGMSAQSVVMGAGGTQVAVQIYDRGGLLSAPMMVPITTLPEVGVGAACDAGHRCRLPSTCGATTMTCDLPPAIAAACMAATAIAVPTPTTTTTTASVMGSVAAGTGQFNGSCGQGGPAAATPGMEAIYTVDVPAGHYDLVAGTEMTAGAMTDTLVYVRSSCGDPGTEVACNDDIDTAGGDYRSHVEVMNVTMGTYTIFVEHWSGGAVSFTLHADLRPVLDAGAACDPAGVMNRCSGGACPSSHLCP